MSHYPQLTIKIENLTFIFKNYIVYFHVNLHQTNTEFTSVYHKYIKKKSKIQANSTVRLFNGAHY